MKLQRFVGFPDPELYLTMKLCRAGSKCFGKKVRQTKPGPKLDTKNIQVRKCRSESHEHSIPNNKRIAPDEVRFLGNYLEMSGPKNETHNKVVKHHVILSKCRSTWQRNLRIVDLHRDVQNLYLTILTMSCSRSFFEKTADFNVFA